MHADQTTENNDSTHHHNDQLGETCVNQKDRNDYLPITQHDNAYKLRKTSTIPTQWSR
jgi:hypothetical protein